MARLLRSCSREGEFDWWVETAWVYKHNKCHQHCILYYILSFSGEHIDYCGYAVLPMAIEQNILAAVSVSDSKTIQLANTEPKYKWVTMFFITEICSIQFSSSNLVKKINSLTCLFIYLLTNNTIYKLLHNSDFFSKNCKFIASIYTLLIVRYKLRIIYIYI